MQINFDLTNGFPSPDHSTITATIENASRPQDAGILKASYESANPQMDAPAEERVTLRAGTEKGHGDCISAAVFCETMEPQFS